MNKSAKKPKSKNWSTNETKLLLELFKERQIIQKMDSKEIRFKDLFKQLESDMKAHGYERCFDQIRNRIKTLKEKYSSIHKELKKSGSGGTANDWEFYSAMDEIYGPRPSLNRKGIDSTKATNQIQEVEEAVLSAPSTRPISENMDETNSLLKTSTPTSSFPSCSKESRNYDDIVASEKQSMSLNSYLPPKKRIRLEESIVPEIDKNIRKEIESSNHVNEKKSEMLESTKDFENSHEVNNIDAQVEDIKNVETKLTEKKLTKREKMEKEKNSFIENLYKQQHERSQMLLNYQAEREKRSMEELSKVLQQNSLLLVQAFAMAQQASPWTTAQSNLQNNFNQIPGNALNLFSGQTSGNMFLPQTVPNIYFYQNPTLPIPNITQPPLQTPYNDQISTLQSNFTGVCPVENDSASLVSQSNLNESVTSNMSPNNQRSTDAIVHSDIFDIELNIVNQENIQTEDKRME